ncbi:site-specific integrase [Actinotalea sp. BY-33]|uniref:Site-specific integrase n=1 Tax=Actinotalea soli TaxID=2819234 RepID=A0A939LMV6_9CELL|nr:site-specific integrase [Actinotalea soli]MBO1750496.1 site-specific integrase [Actinotalea soli]
MAKRANSEGSIYRRASDGRYAAAVTWRDPETGRTRRKTYYGSTRAEVRTKLAAAVERRDSGMPVTDASMTVGDWAMTWLETTLRASPRKATTKELYRRLVLTCLLPTRLARRRLDQLRPSHVDEFIIELSSSRSRHRRTEDAQAPLLAPATVQRVFYVTRLVLNGAVREGLLGRNPALVVRPPRARRHAARFLSATEMEAFLEAARPTRAYPLLAFIAATGVRKGEALALRWSDVDLDGRQVLIRATLARVDGTLVASEPKTASSRRTLPLSPPVVELLRRLATAQEAERAHAGNLWVETGFVFTTETGGPIDPRNVLRAAKVAAAKAGLDGVTVHTLRHSAATVMLEAGVHLKAVSEILGHADIRVTADVYGHVSTEVTRAAMESLGDRMLASD